MTDLAKYGPWAVIAGGSEGVGAPHRDTTDRSMRTRG